MKLYVKLLFLVGCWWAGQKKTKLMLYSTLVEIEVEVGVELGNNIYSVGLGYYAHYEQLRSYQSSSWARCQILAQILQF